MSASRAPAATTSPVAVLKKSKVVAVVGASKNPEKDAHTVPLYLKQRGYGIIPINPTASEILGEKVYPTLLDVPAELAKQIDVVNVFRPSDQLAQVAEQVVELKKSRDVAPVLWGQLGIESEEAKQILTKNGIPYVMNSCIRTTHQLAGLRGK